MRGFCGECGEECNAIIGDFGIGAYEYWGCRGVDIRLAAVSNCCEADVFEDEAKTRMIDICDIKDYEKEIEAESRNEY